MTRKELTREQVIEAILNAPTTIDDGYGSLRRQAEKIADSLGLEEQKPFEQVMWCVLRTQYDEQDLTVFWEKETADSMSKLLLNNTQVMPVLITELSPDDERVLDAHRKSRDEKTV